MRDGDDQEAQTTFEVDLDDATMRRLLDVAELSHTEPKVILSSIIHDVLHDDELENGPLVPSSEHDLTKH